MRTLFLLTAGIAFGGCQFHAARNLAKSNLEVAVSLHALQQVSATPGGPQSLSSEEMTKCQNAYNAHADTIDQKRATVVAFGVLTGAGGAVTAAVASANPSNSPPTMMQTMTGQQASGRPLNAYDATSITLGAASAVFGIVAAAVSGSESSDQDKMTTILRLIKEGALPGEVGIYCR